MAVEEARYSILIADDDDEQRFALRNIFEPRGYRTVLAADGTEVVSIVEEGEPVDCLLLDEHMPGLGGLDTLKILRAEHRVLPCILITAESSDRILRRALALHAFSVLNKPVSQGLVTFTVRRALRHLGGREGRE